jgi:hypothetical protein
MTPALPVDERQLRHVAALWTASRQAVAYRYFFMWGAKAKTQVCVEALSAIVSARDRFSPLKQQ